MKTVNGVPESLTREQYTSLIAAVGFNVENLRKLEFRVEGVYAEVVERRPDGSFVIHSKDGTVAVNTVFIPIRDPEPDGP